jgi:hypothetical protein
LSRPDAAIDRRACDGTGTAPEARQSVQRRSIDRGDHDDQDCAHDADDPTSEAEHFWKCEACGGWFDMRDLGAVLDHEKPLPHPASDQAQ